MSGKQEILGAVQSWPDEQRHLVEDLLEIISRTHAELFNAKEGLYDFLSTMSPHIKNANPDDAMSFGRGMAIWQRCDAYHEAMKETFFTNQTVLEKMEKYAALNGIETAHEQLSLPMNNPVTSPDLHV